MSEFTGLAAHAAGAELLPFRYRPGDLGPHEVEVRVSHCGLSRADLHLIDNDWGTSKFPFIPGHEIVGQVIAIGAEVSDHQPGDRVGIGWQSSSCAICEWCRSGEEHLCPKAQLTCIGRQGGFADRIRVNHRFAIPVPATLPSEGAAPLLCAGITVYKPLRDHLARPASRVAVAGIGGLGHLALQFARAFGCEVTAISTDRAKEPDALTLGAHRFINVRETAALKKLSGSFDLILSTIPADQDLQGFVGALRPRGALVMLAASPKPFQVTAASLIGCERTLSGSAIGSPHVIAEMLEVAARHGIKATTELFPMKDANKAVARLKQNKVRYRAVLAN
jgi:alcohol/geraniol dehydrogenase (NADP+)